MPTIKKPSVAQNQGFARSELFILLEVLVVIGIIALLARPFVIQPFLEAAARAKTETARAHMRTLEQALFQYNLDTGRFPTTAQGLAALSSRPSDEPRWRGPYITGDIPLDPWGRSYVYRAPGQYGEFDLYSHGRDGRPGGDGEDSDITSRQKD